MKSDYQTIQVELRDNVAVFIMNNPPVNQLSTQFRSDLAEAFGEAYGDDAVKAIVITGTGKNFIAGADITEVQQVKSKEDLVSGMMEGMKFMNHIETGPKAVVAAINGNCLGGGLELALTFDYLLAEDDPACKLGLPEVKLGIHPGYGGSVRLIERIGAPKAMDMMLSGRSVGAHAALKQGLVDRLSPRRHLHETARFMLLQQPMPARRPAWWRIANSRPEVMR